MKQTRLIIAAILLLSVSSLVLAVEYSIGSWKKDGKGNHRAEVRVEQGGPAVWTHIEWRRRDHQPEKKAILVFDAATGKQVRNAVLVRANRISGDVVFQPVTVPGTYYIYYLPYNVGDTPVYFVDPKVLTQYLKHVDTASPSWLKEIGYKNARSFAFRLDSLPKAKLVGIQAASEFDRFDPMEVIASRKETRDLLKEYPQLDYLVFPEDRSRPIRMFDDLPLCWIQRGPSNMFEATAKPNEYYCFQLGLWAARTELKDVKLTFGELKTEDGKVIPASALRCFNLGGTDWAGKKFIKRVDVHKGYVQPLWIGVDIPKDAAGNYKGTILVKPENAPVAEIKVELDIKGEMLADRGDSNPYLLSRLRWLDSTIGLNDEVPPPFTPLERDGNKISCWNRKVIFNELGFPVSIKSGNTELLAGPVEFNVITGKGPCDFTSKEKKTLKTSPAIIVEQAEAQGGPLSMSDKWSMEFDGCIKYDVTLKASENVDISDISLRVPLRLDAVKYMMGLGKRGGIRPDKWDWKWDIKRANNFLWAGDVTAGLQLKLLYPTDVWPTSSLETVGLPESWDNRRQGGCTVAIKGDEYVVRAYTGHREIKAGQSLALRFRFLVTPFKPIDKNHWNWRILQTGDYPESNILHVHHGFQGVNSFINYPFLEEDGLKALMKRNPTKKINLYYTVIHFSTRAPELWALRSMGDEFFSKQAFIWTCKGASFNEQGDGYAWLREHLVNGYAPGWVQPLPNDIDPAIAATGLSRWHNYYIEGMRYLMENTGLDGLYLDGIGYDREIMKRLYKTMKTINPDSRIHFHEGNNYDYLERRVNPMAQHSEHLPYVAQLWFGEMFDYNSQPDYWLVEMSGIPFGVTNEMLNYENGGNAYRGMLYGMSGRCHPSVRAMWTFWDAFGIQDAEMIGYWSKDCPVKTNREDVLATVYKKKGKILIALANWAKQKVNVKLNIEWKALGIDPAKASLKAPGIQNFQKAESFSVSHPIPVGPDKGWLLILSEKK